EQLPRWNARTGIARDQLTTTQQQLAQDRARACPASLLRTQRVITSCLRSLAAPACSPRAGPARGALYCPLGSISRTCAPSCTTTPTGGTSASQAAISAALNDTPSACAVP